MADWTDVANTTLEPDAPLISSTMFALRDNPKALAEGAAGAPRVVNAAIAADSLDAGKTLAVSAGSVIRFRDDAEQDMGDEGNWITVVDEYVLSVGTLRASVDIQAANSGTASARVLVGGSIVEEWSTTNTSLQTFETDFSFGRNARIRIQVKGVASVGSGGFSQNHRLKTSGGRLWPGRAGFVY